MCAPVVGAVLIHLEFQAGGGGTDRDAIQQPPEQIIAKFREIADRILEGSGGRALGAADSGGDHLVETCLLYTSDAADE